MNSYVKLFSELAEIKPFGKMIAIGEVEDLGFLLTDLERLHDEGYIFLERHTKAKDMQKGSKIVRHYIKLAPKGYQSLEEYKKEKRQKQRNNLLTDSTIVLVQIAIIGIIIEIVDRFGINLLNPGIEISFGLSVIISIIFVAFSLLLMFKVLHIIFSKEGWRGIFIFDD